MEQSPINRLLFSRFTFDEEMWDKLVCKDKGHPYSTLHLLARKPTPESGLTLMHCTEWLHISQLVAKNMVSTLLCLLCRNVDRGLEEEEAPEPAQRIFPIHSRTIVIATCISHRYPKAPCSGPTHFCCSCQQ